MRVLVCGDRHWTNKDAIRSALSYVPGLQVVIEGEAPGADSLAREVAEEMGIAVEAYPADWARYRRGAGPVRNQQMLDEGKPDLVLAFHDNLLESKGTGDMVRRAYKALVPVYVYEHVDKPRNVVLCRVVTERG